MWSRNDFHRGRDRRAALTPRFPPIDASPRDRTVARSRLHFLEILAHHVDPRCPEPQDSLRYDRPVTLSPHVVRLRPAPHCRTPILSYSLRVEPETHFLNWQQDPYSNYLARLVFPEPARELSIEVDLVADMTVINPFDFFIEESAEKYPFTYDATLAKELVPYLETEPAGPCLRGSSRACAPPTLIQSIISSSSTGGFNERSAT